MIVTFIALTLAVAPISQPQALPAPHAAVVVYSDDQEGGQTLCDDLEDYLGETCLVQSTELAPPPPYDAANTNPATEVALFTDQPLKSQGPQVTAAMIADKFPVGVVVLPECLAPAVGDAGTTYDPYNGPREDQLFSNTI